MFLLRKKASYLELGKCEEVRKKCEKGESDWTAKTGSLTLLHLSYTCMSSDM